MSVTIKNPEEITILATGGTIDKFYSVAGTMDIGEPAAKDLLDRVITDVRFDIRPLIGKDSLDMTDEDRAELTEALDAVTNAQVLITHGTDTMPETARYLLEHAKLGEKVVVLTGAMQPAVMARSDAGFNLGAAIAALNLLDPGVYISMSGRIFPAESVRKDRSAAPGPRGSELSEPAEALVVEPWDIGSSEPLPAKVLYAVRVVLLIAPALGMVYFFMRAALFPVGAVPLVYLVVQGWLATIYRADRSVMLIYWGNAVSALLAEVMGVFFAYLLFALHGPDALFKHFGTFYAGAVFTVMGSFVLEFFFSLFYAVVLRRVIRRNEAFHRGSFSENTGG